MINPTTYVFNEKHCQNQVLTQTFVLHTSWTRQHSGSTGLASQDVAVPLTVIRVAFVPLSAYDTPPLRMLARVSESELVVGIRRQKFVHCYEYHLEDRVRMPQTLYRH